MFEYPFLSPLYLTLTIIYFLVSSVVVFDIRLTQAKKFEGIDYGTLPAWTGIFYFVQWGLFITLAVLNWKYALIIFIVKFILKVLPVLEMVGNILMSPFKPKDVDDDEIERLGKELTEKTGIDYKEVLKNIQKDEEGFQKNRKS